MAKLQEVIPDDLNIFEEKPLLICIDGNSTEEILPLNSLDNCTSIEFNSLPYIDKYKDLGSICLKLHVKFVKSADNSNFEAKDTAQPNLASNGLMSIFKDCQVTIGGSNVVNVDHIAYKSYVETLMNFNVETAESLLETQGFVPNQNETSLKNIFKNSTTYELYGPLNVITTSKLLIPGVGVSLRLNLHNPNFFIKEATALSNLKILSAKLYMRHVKVKDAISLSHEKILASGMNARYEFKKGVLSCQNVSAGTSDLNIANLYTGTKPSLIGFFMVLNQSATGQRSTSPFDMKPFNLNTFQFVVNGVLVPQNAYEIVSSNSEKKYNHLFAKVYEALGHKSSGKTALLTRDNFIKDHFIVIQDCSTFGTVAVDEIKEIPTECTIGIVAKLSQALSATITCFLYAQIDGRFEVTSNRTVLVIQ